MLRNGTSNTRSVGDIVEISVRDWDDGLSNNIGRAEQAKLQRLDALRDLVDDLLLAGVLFGGLRHGREGIGACGYRIWIMICARRAVVSGRGVVVDAVGGCRTSNAEI